MGHVKEPVGIDLVVEPTRLTKEDREFISKIISDYKTTGKKPSLKKKIKGTNKVITSKSKQYA